MEAKVLLITRLFDYYGTISVGGINVPCTGYLAPMRADM